MHLFSAKRFRALPGLICVFLYCGQGFNENQQQFPTEAKERTQPLGRARNIADLSGVAGACNLCPGSSRPSCGYRCGSLPDLRGDALRGASFPRCSSYCFRSGHRSGSGPGAALGRKTLALHSLQSTPSNRSLRGQDARTQLFEAVATAFPECLQADRSSLAHS